MKEPMDDAMMEMMDFTKGRLMMGGNIPFPAKLKNRMRKNTHVDNGYTHSYYKGGCST